MYSRLIRKYYATELPIPADVKAVQRLVGARTPAERQAVEAVLQEFFVLHEDGWHNERCDQELERYREAQPIRDAKKDHAKERQRRARERRKELFAALRSHGQVPHWDTPVTQLEMLLSRVTGPSQAEPVTRDNTASQSPLPSPQSPDTRKDIKPKNNAAAAASTSRGSRIPIPFQITDEMRAWAITELPGFDVDAPTVEFVDYWRAVSGSKGVKLDWVATWRNRMREVRSRKPIRNGNGFHDPPEGVDADGIPAWVTPEERAQILSERKEQNRAN